MNESSKKNSEKEDKTMYNEEMQIKFDNIVEYFNPDDEISVENANYEMRKNWQKFLKAGCNASLIAKMMSPSDIWEHYDELVAAGAEIKDSAVVEYWIERYGCLYFSDYSLSDLPDAVSADKVVAFFSIKDIINYCSPYDFSDFVEDFLSVGLDINVLAQKFMDEIGYSTGGPREAGALLDLVENGASTFIIDPAKYLELVDVDTLNECEGQNWYRYFREHGYGIDELEKLSDYAVEDDEDY